MNLFKTPEQSFADFDAETAASIIRASADIALVLDEDGVIRDVAVGPGDLAGEDCSEWLNKPLTSIVTLESRPKIEELIHAASQHGEPRWRHVNHLNGQGNDLPVLYSAVPLGNDGRVLALGRDMRALSELQQRLVDMQQSVERDYARVRHLETRYRLLFQMAREAVVVVDAANRRIMETNPAASELLGVEVGETFLDGLDTPSGEALQALLGRVQALGRSEDIRVNAPDGSRELIISASLFRQDGNGLFLVRVSPADGAVDEGCEDEHSRVLEIMESAPDGLVITGMDGRILGANSAFLELAELATEEQARNEHLDRWLGRPGVDFNVLAANLKEHGSIRMFATVLRGEYGAREEVEISAVSVPAGTPPCLGFIIRSVGRRPRFNPKAANGMPHSADQLKELVGKMPLKDLVRETTDLIERLCIQAALELTGDNRASAAEMLGLSRQSLYVKLRRYGLGELESDGG